MYIVSLRGVKTPGNKKLTPGKGNEMGFMTSPQQLTRLLWLGSQQVLGEDSSSRPRSLFPKNVGAACLHKQLYLRNRNFNWLKPTVWNLEWKLGSPPPQHLYFGLWSFARTAGSINWLLAVSCIIHLCTKKKQKRKKKKTSGSEEVAQKVGLWLEWLVPAGLWSKWTFCMFLWWKEKQLSSGISGKFVTRENFISRLYSFILFFAEISLRAGAMSYLSLLHPSQHSAWHLVGSQ